MKRPVGVTLAACSLILVSLGLLLTLAFVAASAFLVRHSQGAALIGLAVFAVPLIALLVWLLITTAGLFRLRPSARTSMQILSILLILFGLLEFAVAFFVRSVSPHASGASSAEMLGYALGMVLPGAFFLALGIWWAIYFNLEAVALCFRPDWQRTPYPAADPYAASSTTLPALPCPAAPAHSRPNQPPPLPYPARTPGRFDHVPASVQILAWLLGFSACTSLLLALTPLPIFIGGSVLAGLSGHLLWLAVGLVSGACAWGFFHLARWSLYLAWFLLLLASLNVLLALTQHALDNLNLYVERILQAFHLPNQPAFRFHYTAAMMLPSTLFGLCLYATAAWFLYKHRSRFTNPSNLAPPS